MFEHILVPLDGSVLAESVLPHALAVADSCGSQLTLMHVLDQATTHTPVDPSRWYFCKVEGQAYLQDVCRRLYDLRWQSATVLDEGQAADCIIRYTHDNQISLIAMSSHGRSGLSGWNISSVVQKVLLRAATSVLIVPAYRSFQADLSRINYRRIMIPLDCSQRAEVVLPIGAKLAGLQGGALHLVHIVSRPMLPSNLPLTPEEHQLCDQVVERNQSQAMHYLAELQSRFAGHSLDVQTYVEVSETPLETLHELVEAVQPDLVLLSAHGSTGYCRWPYGSVTLSFIAYGSQPLLILQDLLPAHIRPSLAELAAREQPVH